MSELWIREKFVNSTLADLLYYFRPSRSIYKLADNPISHKHFQSSISNLTQPLIPLSFTVAHCHQLYLNRILNFIRFFPLPPIHPHVNNISLPVFLLPSSALLFICKEGDKHHTRPPWLHYSWSKCLLQSWLDVEMEPAALITASPHPPPAVSKDQIQCQLPEVWSSMWSHSLKWRITWMMPLLHIPWPSSEKLEKTHLAFRHSSHMVKRTHLISVKGICSARPVERGCPISLRSVPLYLVRTHAISPSLYSKDHKYYMIWLV